MKDDALHINQGSAWQLLFQFVATDGAACERESSQWIAEVVQKLGLPPRQTDRIGNAVIEALRKAARDGTEGQPKQPVTVRIWVSDGYAKERPRSNSHGKEVGRPAQGGWGFFVIQKHEEASPATAGEAPLLVELFLYQEGDRARQDRRTSQA